MLKCTNRMITPKKVQHTFFYLSVVVLCCSIPRGPQGEDLISPEARDLLLRMLCPDPRRRITVPQICQHPWFCQHLPAEALHTNDDCLRLSSEALSLASKLR